MAWTAAAWELLHPMKRSETAPVDGSPPRKPARPEPYTSAIVVTAATTNQPELNANNRWNKRAPVMQRFFSGFQHGLRVWLNIHVAQLLLIKRHMTQCSTAIPYLYGDSLHIPSQKSARRTMIPTNSNMEILTCFSASTVYSTQANSNVFCLHHDSFPMGTPKYLLF